AGIPSATQTTILGGNQPERVLAHNRRCFIRRPIVDDDHLEIRILKPPQTVEAVADSACSVVAADHDRDAWPGHSPWEWRLGERCAPSGQRRFRASITVREAEVPVLDVVSATVPFVCPGKDKRPGAARFERGSHLPVEYARLDVLAVPAAVQSDLGHHQWPVA